MAPPDPSVPPEPSVLVDVLLRRHGRTFAAEADIRLESNRPSALFQLLCLALLISARIRGEVALAAAVALKASGWTTPEKMAQSSWAARTKVLNAAGYARYDESTSRYLGAAAELVIDRYRGDLRHLRAEAAGSMDLLTRRLTEFKGIGNVGASFFVREVQVVWDEFVPYMDDRARAGAEALGLPTDPHELRAVASRESFAVLVAALIRADHSNDIDTVLEMAANP